MVSFRTTCHLKRKGSSYLQCLQADARIAQAHFSQKNIPSDTFDRAEAIATMNPLELACDSRTHIVFLYVRGMVSFGPSGHLKCEIVPYLQLLQVYTAFRQASFSQKDII